MCLGFLVALIAVHDCNGAGGTHCCDASYKTDISHVNTMYTHVFEAATVLSLSFYYNYFYQTSNMNIQNMLF